MSEELRREYEYQPSTPAKVQAYNAIAFHEEAAHATFITELRNVGEADDADRAEAAAQGLELTSHGPRVRASFTRITNACLALALAIEEWAPPSADRSAALRCVKLARMAANDEVCWRCQRPAYGATLHLSLVEFAHVQLRAARYQANAAIALAENYQGPNQPSGPFTPASTEPPSPGPVESDR